MSKNKYWTAVMYPENMILEWQTDIGDLLQVPYCYCIHDKDLTSTADQRKKHVHIIIAFNNTTTYKHAMSVFKRLELPDHTALNTCEPVISIRHAYDYLIHDTEESRKKGKFQYQASDRVCGNNFDIGSFEQLSAAEKNDMAWELCKDIRINGITNFADFFDYVFANYDKSYFEIIKTHSGLFDRMIKGMYHKLVVDQLEEERKRLETIEKTDS